MTFLIMLGIGLTIGGLVIALDDDDDGASGEKINGDGEQNDLAGGEGNDTVFAGDETDILAGNGGEDRLFGQDGEDLLLGGEGDDFLRGGSGSDTLIDSEGSDTLIGGLGSDLIVATSAVDPDAAAQVVRDWIANEDPDERIQLDFDGSDDTDDDGDVILAGYGNDDVVAGNGDTVTLGEGRDELFIGDWMEAGDDPVTVTDFNPAEDAIVYSHDGEGPVPELTLNRADDGSDDGETHLFADDVLVARIQGAADSVTLSNILVLDRSLS